MKKIYNVKFTLLALLMVCLFGVNEKAWAYWTTDKDGNAQADNASIQGYVKYTGGVYYVVYDDSEHSFSVAGSGGGSYTSNLSGPGSQLSFTAKRTPTGIGNLVVTDGYTDLYSGNPGGNVKKAFGVEYSVDYASYGAYGINIDSKSIRFHGEWGSYSKYVNNIRVTMGSYCEPAATSVAFGNNYFGTSEDKTLKVYWSNTGNKTISKSGDTERFTLSTETIPSTAGYYGNTVVTITYKRDVAGSHSMTLTVNGKTVTVTGSTEKLTNTITWTPDTISKKDWNGTLTGNATATNTNYSGDANSRAITYTSSNTSYATVSGNVITFLAAGEGKKVTITASQAENYKYKAASQTRTFEIKKTQSIVWDPEKVNTNMRLSKTRDIADYTYANPSGNRKISYSSADPTIISVDGTVLTANKVGKVNIIATLEGDDDYNEVTSNKEFEVKEKEAVVFKLGAAIITDDNDSLALTVGQTSAEITSNNTDKEIGYISSEENVAIYNTTTNRIEAKGAGKATVTLLQESTDDWQAGKRAVYVTVSLNTTKISTSESEKTLEVGGTYDPELSTTNSEVEMTITSDKPAVAVYEDGVIKAKGQGSATITFRQDKTTKWTGDTVTVAVTVNKKTPTLSIPGFPANAWNTTIKPNITSTNEDSNCAITISKVSGSDDAARIFGSTIKVYDKDGADFVFCVSQEGNDTYEAVSQNCTIHVQKPNNHVTFTYGTDLKAKKGKYTSVIEFEGVPSQVSCNLTEDALSDAYFYVWEAPSKNDDFTQVGDQHTNATSLKESLKPSTRAIKFQFDGAYLMSDSKEGTFSKIKVTERKGIEINGLTDGYYDFGSAYEVGNPATDRAISLGWYSVPTTTVTSSNPGVFDVITETIDSKIDDFDPSTSVTIRYHHKAVTAGDKDEATITLTSENGYTTSFKVKGKTNKKNQTLIWQEELSPISVGDVIPNPAIAPLALNYSIKETSEEGVIEMEGTVLKAKKVGTVTLRAYNGGDASWNSISGDYTIKVTDLKVQHINWQQTFTRLTTSDADETLTATAYEIVNGEHVAITSRPVNYVSDNESVVTVVNGKLHVVGVGTANLKASVAGVTGEYEPAEVTRPVKVRVKSTGCTPYVLTNESYELFTIETKELNLKGEPAQITFKAWSSKWLLVSPSSSPMKFAEYYDGGWHERWSNALEIDNHQSFGPINLNRNTTKVKFYTEIGATCYHSFEQAYVTKAKYLELDNTVNKTTTSVAFSNATVGQTYIQSVDVRYSNIYDMLYVNHTNPNFRITPTEIGESCGQDGHATVTIIYYAKEAINESDVITITDEHGLTATINVSAQVAKSDQTITWNPATELKTTDNVTFDATASSELAVKYELAEGDAEVAELTEDGKLTIKTAGDIHVTVSQEGSGLYNPVELEPVTITISKVTPTVSVTPIAPAVTLPNILSASELNVSDAVMLDDKGTTVDGTYSWKAGTTNLTAGTKNYTVSFAPEKNAWYNVAEFEVAVTANKRNQVITWGVTDNQTVPCSAIIPLNAVLTDDYSKEEMAETLTYVSNKKDCAEILDGELVVKTPGTVTITVSRAEDGVYNSASITRTITFEKTTPVIDILPEAVSIYEEQWLHESALKGGYVRSGERKVQGSFVWTTEDFQAVTVGTQEYDAVFIPANEACYERVACKVPMTILQIERIFKDITGDNDWSNPKNWSNGFVPPMANVDVSIEKDVVISGTASVGTMTIQEGATVTVTGQLTVSGNQESANGNYGNIVVKEGGELVVTNTFTVNNFTLEAQLGSTVENVTSPSASGQVSGADNLAINGDVYFQLAVDPSGRNTYGWYDFVVPFEVEVIGGISIAEAPTTPMQFNVNYAVMSYDEAKRAVNGKDWNKFSGTMEPGRVYTITLDETQPWNTVVFKKKKGAPITGDRSFTTSYSGLGASVDNGWNGFGNGSLQHMELDVPEGTLVQVYDHTNKCYQPRPAKDMSIAVGLSFFLQVDGVQTITLQPAEENTAFLAPRRVRENGADKFRLALTAEGATNASDYLWVSASEDATGAYVIGRDVLKMGTMTSSKVARMWSRRNNINLCSNEMVLVNDHAECEISLYAPNATTYTIDIERAPENATLYLTYNGNIIWDLTASPYTIDLAKGTTTGYGLRMEINRTPAISTGVENADANGQKARKVVIDDQMYIITPDGAMYNVNGKIVR